MDKEFESVSPTAIITSYPRIFTDIPYEKEIYSILSKDSVEVPLNKMIAPQIEARYRLIDKMIDKYGYKQILELAAGYSSRGLNYSLKGYNYVELDLDNIVIDKRKILNEIKEIPNNLNIIEGNALDEYNVDKYFDSNKELIVVNEGLLRYLTFEEKKKVSKNIYNLLKKYGGVWITCDLSPKANIDLDNESNKFLKEISSITDRNNINDRFKDLDDMKSFFNELGFEVIEIEKLISIKDELVSVNKYNIYDKINDQVLNNSYVVVLKVRGSEV